MLIRLDWLVEYLSCIVRSCLCISTACYTGLLGHMVSLGIQVAGVKYVIYFC